MCGTVLHCCGHNVTHLTAGVHKVRHRVAILRARVWEDGKELGKHRFQFIC